MKISFKDIAVSEMDSFKGGNGTLLANMFNDENTKIVKFVIKQGCSVGEHEHLGNFEVCYVESGVATATYDGKVETINKGEVHYCPKGHSHSIRNDEKEDLILICVIPNIG